MTAGAGFLFVGVDLSARRGFDVAVLDEQRQVDQLWHAPNLDALVARLDALPEAMVVAVDAPQAPSDFPLRRQEVRAALATPPPPGLYRRHRVCDYELARRSIGLYLLPEPGAAPPEWMSLGFATFSRLHAEFGLRLPIRTDDHGATLLEIYPYAGFVTLLGGRPPRKTTPAGAAARRDALNAAGLTGLPERRITHDEADALCAAYTAWAWRHGSGCALGLPDEGLLVLPVRSGALRDSYRRRN